MLLLLRMHRKDKRFRSFEFMPNKFVWTSYVTDDELFYFNKGADIDICSVSFRAKRYFEVVNNYEDKAYLQQMGNGFVLAMLGQSQCYSKHRVLKQTEIYENNWRFKLTYRYLLKHQ